MSDFTTKTANEQTLSKAASNASKAGFFKKNGRDNPAGTILRKETDVSRLGNIIQNGNNQSPFSAFNSFSNSSGIQTKLTIGRKDDKYEQEADRVANKVMSMPEPQVQKQNEEEEPVQGKFIQKKDNNTTTQIADSGFESKLNSTKNSGNSMPESTRNFMESRMGVNFSNVKVHTGSHAMQMNKELNTQAFTHGNDIYFNSGKYNPGSNSGKQLLAHELAHTVQQKGVRQKIINKAKEEKSSYGLIEKNVWIGNQKVESSIIRSKIFLIDDTPQTLYFKQGRPYNINEGPKEILIDSSYVKLNSLIRLFPIYDRLSNNKFKVSLVGFTSSEDTADYNLKLADRRNKVVEKWLKDAKIKVGTVTNVGEIAPLINKESSRPIDEKDRKVQIIPEESLYSIDCKIDYSGHIWVYINFELIFDTSDEEYLKIPVNILNAATIKDIFNQLRELKTRIEIGKEIENESDRIKCIKNIINLINIIEKQL